MNIIQIFTIKCQLFHKKKKEKKRKNTTSKMMIIIIPITYTTHNNISLGF